MGLYVSVCFPGVLSRDRPLHRADRGFAAGPFPWLPEEGDPGTLLLLRHPAVSTANQRQTNLRRGKLYYYSLIFFISDIIWEKVAYC